MLITHLFLDTVLYLYLPLFLSLDWSVLLISLLTTCHSHCYLCIFIFFSIKSHHCPSFCSFMHNITIVFASSTEWMLLYDHDFVLYKFHTYDYSCINNCSMPTYLVAPHGRNMHGLGYVYICPVSYLFTLRYNHIYLQAIVYSPCEGLWQRKLTAFVTAYVFHAWRSMGCTDLLTRFCGWRGKGGRGKNRLIPRGDPPLWRLINAPQ